MSLPKPEHPENAIVYIREIAVSDLPDAIRAQLGDAEQVWGVHTPEGECLALARDRRTAFFVARENEFAPVSAH